LRLARDRKSRRTLFETVPPGKRAVFWRSPEPAPGWHDSVRKLIAEIIASLHPVPCLF
jgi:hypothetical protein